MKTIIKNLETLKLELHFEKAEYAALTDKQKAELKSAYLWSNAGKCWVSRAKEPNTYRAEKVAATLGFSGIEKVGERLTYAEQLDRKAERAEARADRYDGYAETALRRCDAMQAPLNSMRGDIAFFTQPIIAGHKGSQAFARQRERMYERYERGFAEYRKSEYFRGRAATARTTAENGKLQDRVYLDTRIKERNKNLRDLQKSIVTIEEYLFRLEQGEILKRYDGSCMTIAQLEERLESIMERYEAEQDKLDFFEDCMEQLGGVAFSQANVKTGYIVEMARWGKCEIIKAGKVNVAYKILQGGAAGGVLTDSYAAIERILEEAKAAEIVNPYAEGDILVVYHHATGSAWKAFQVLKATEKSVQIQQIAMTERIPQRGHFLPDSMPMRKGITKSKYSDFVGAYDGDRQLHKWMPQEQIA